MTRAPHISILEAALTERRAKNSRYSLRAFAKFLDLHASALSRILNGKQELSISAALQIIRKLKMPPDDQERFMLSLAIERSRQTLHALSAPPEIKIATTEKFNAMFELADAIPAFLWRSEVDGRTTWFNRFWHDYTGLTTEQSLDWGWVDAIHPEDRQRSAENYRRAVEHGEALKQRHRVRASNGQYRWFLVHACPSIDPTGKVVSMLGVGTDIQDLSVS